jgi:hypothetical protein
MGSRARPMAAQWQHRRRYGEPVARGGGGVGRGECRWGGALILGWQREGGSPKSIAHGSTSWVELPVNKGSEGWSVPELEGMQRCTRAGWSSRRRCLDRTGTRRVRHRRQCHYGHSLWWMTARWRARVKGITWAHKDIGVSAWGWATPGSSAQ